MGKRAIGGNWTTYDTGKTALTDDSHCVAVLGIDSAGYIHVSYNMHDDPLKYIKSNNPEDPSAFSNATMTGADETSVTYPRFFKVGTTLFCSYRNGSAISGNQHLNKYNTGTQTWSSVYHPFFNAGGAAAYVDNFAVGDDNRIHVSFMARTSNSPITLSNYSYAYSDDLGVTWKKADGSTISMPLTQTNADVFEPGDIPGLPNQCSIDVDSNGHPHIAYLKNSTVEGKLNYFHAWHDGTQWLKQQLTTYTDTPSGIVTFFELNIARPRILIDRRDNSVYIFGRKSQGGVINVWKARDPFSNFQKFRLGPDAWGVMEFGGVDYDYWHSTHILNLMATLATGSSAPIYSLESNLQ